MNDHRPSIAVVDYGLGNLFSVMQACVHAGGQPCLADTPQQLLSADAVLLPGVGAFGDAMQALSRLNLVGPLRDVAQSGKPLIGICLGLQLLLTESAEFGTHRGLDIISGCVMRFDRPQGCEGPLKVPHVGWAPIHRPVAGNRPPAQAAASAQPAATPGTLSDPWQGTPLEGQDDGQYMYFVHSYYVVPSPPEVVSSLSRYGDFQYCSAIRQGNVWGFQFHPERSGPPGLQIYQQMLQLIQPTERPEEGQHAA